MHLAATMSAVKAFVTGEKCCNSEEPTVARFRGKSCMDNPVWE